MCNSTEVGGHQAIASRLEAIATRVEAIALRAEAIASGWRPALLGWRPSPGAPLFQLNHMAFDLALDY